MVCLRPFNWRKKWAKDWQEVKYCSKRCAGHRIKQKTVITTVAEKSIVLPTKQVNNRMANKTVL